MTNGVVTLPLAGCWTADEADGAAANVVAREFVAGPENRLAAATVQRLLAVKAEDVSPHPDPLPEGEGDHTAPLRYLSPLVLHGVPGTGKSHLVRGLAETWKRLRPDESVVVLTASEFAQEYAEAVDQRAVGRWQTRFRSADLFVLEDLLQLANKPAAQAELLYTLDALADCGSLAIVTSRLSPAEMPNLLAGLQSRLMAGLCVPLAAPEADARRHILAKLCAQRQLALSDATLRLLARSLSLPAPELSGVLSNLELAARTANHPLDDSFVKAYIAQRNASRQPPLKTIASHTARYFALRVVELRSSSRRRGVVTARDVAMYLARQLTGKSLKQIGAYFGGRDHTTVLHGCRKTERLMHSDSETLEAVLALRQGLATE